MHYETDSAVGKLILGFYIFMFCLGVAAEIRRVLSRRPHKDYGQCLRAVLVFVPSITVAAHYDGLAGLTMLTLGISLEVVAAIRIHKLYRKQIRQ